MRLPWSFPESGAHICKEAGFLRLKEHSVLGAYPYGPEVTVTVDGEEISARAGEPVAVAMMAAGVWVMRRTHKLDQPRGLFCGIGQCGECRLTVNGIPNVLSCQEPVQEGMEIRTQAGLLSIKGGDGR